MSAPADIILEGGALTLEQSQHIRDRFELLDDDKDGLITGSQVITLFRSLGQCIGDKEINEKIEILPEKIDCKIFEEFFVAHYKPLVDEADIVKAFEVFDVMRKGFIKSDKFKEILTGLGDSLNEEELEEIAQELNMDFGKDVDYKEFAKNLKAGPWTSRAVVPRDLPGHE